MTTDMPKCPHCSEELKKWRPPEDSTWNADFMWVCFNDDCSYFVKGWDHMMNTQNVKASYRHRMDPKNGSTGPLPAWNKDAHKDCIIED